MQIVTTKYVDGVKTFDKMIHVVLEPDIRPPQAHIYANGDELDYFVTHN